MLSLQNMFQLVTVMCHIVENNNDSKGIPLDPIWKQLIQSVTKQTESCKSMVNNSVWAFIPKCGFKLNLAQLTNNNPNRS